MGDDVADLVLAPLVLGAGEAQRAERPRVVWVRPRNRGDLIGREGVRQKPGEVGKRVRRVAGEVLVDAPEARAVVGSAARIEAWGRGDDPRDREPKLVIEVVDEEHRASRSRPVARPVQGRIDVVDARAVVVALRCAGLVVVAGRLGVARRQRAVEPRVAASGRSERLPDLELELLGQEQGQRLAAALFIVGA